MGLLEVLKLRRPQGTADEQQGLLDSGADEGEGGTDADATKPVADDLPTAQQKYADARKDVESGDLASVPDKAPPGLEAVHAAVQKAHKALPALPATLPACAAAMKALKALAKDVAAYKQAETKTLAALKAKYDKEKAAIDLDLAKVPVEIPVGLETESGAISTSQIGISSDPQTIEEYVAAIKAQPALKKAVAAYLKAEAKKKRVDAALSEYGAKGAKLADLKDSDKLNDAQKEILDEKLKAKIGGADKELSEKELKAYAQTVVEKTNKLAETPLEKKIPGLNGALAKSDKLKTNIVKLQAAKWTIKANAPGKGSYCDKVNKTIAIDPTSPLDLTLGNLSHETGHALYTPPPKPTLKASASGIDYVKNATKVDFLDEGEAQMMACKTTKELAAQGQASKVPADGGAFMAIYDKFVKGDLTEDAARIEMAKKFGALTTSTTHETYIQYYGGSHLKTWNAAHKSEPAKQLLPAVLVGLDPFSP